MKPFTEQIRLIDGGKFAGQTVNDTCPHCYFFSPHVTDPGMGYRCKVHGSCPAVDLSPDDQARIWKELDAAV